MPFAFLRFNDSISLCCQFRIVFFRFCLSSCSFPISPKDDEKYKVGDVGEEEDYVAAEKLKKGRYRL